jgi:glycosyltransferase involved in cell wall biosynthesis
MHTPGVSLCVPVWNPSAHLTEALTSAHAQSFRDFELLVVDDASARDVREHLPAQVVHDARLRFVRLRRRHGLPGAWNACLELARAPLVKFLFQDDLLAADALERLVDAWQAGEAVLAFGRRAIRHEGTLLERPLLGSEYARASATFYASLPLGGRVSGLALVQAIADGQRHPATNVLGEPSFVLLERDVARRAHGFDTRLRQLPDWDLWLRLLRDRPAAFVDAELGTFRLHAAGATFSQANPDRQWREELRLLNNIQRTYGRRLEADTRARLARLRWRTRLRGLRAWLRPGTAPVTA